MKRFPLLTRRRVGPQVASISKTVCGTAVMRLHDQGKLDVEARVQDYLPGFALDDPTAASELRLWHLLTHTPGFEGQLDTPDRGPATSAHFVETLRELPQLARPGEVWSYNNAGWGVRQQAKDHLSRLRNEKCDTRNFSICQDKL